MRTVKLVLEGTSPMIQQKYYASEIPALPKEGHADYEERTWRNKLHFNTDGEVLVPAQAIKNVIKGRAQKMSIKKKGAATWTSNFKSGLMVEHDVVLKDESGNPVLKDKVAKKVMFVPTDGKAGSGKRVEKIFPVINSKWQAEVEVLVLDDEIPERVFEDVVREAGRFQGLGSMRPENGGDYGRFAVKSIEWKK